MFTFPPGTELIEAQARLRRLVDLVVQQLDSGMLPDDAERQHVDCKEEAGRRGAGGVLLPGDPRNLAAADALANEVACFANTPGGGALLVGVENATGALLGAALDEDWLRHRIYERVEVAPAVEPIDVGGVRLLVLYMAEAREPVEGTDGKLRWRTGGHCVGVDRAEWWLHRQDSVGHDEMAGATDRTLDDTAPGALLLARRYLREGLRGDTADLASASDVDLLGRLGVRRPDGRVTQAGVLLFCPAERSHLTLSVLDVEEGDVLLAPSDLSGLSLLEQIAAVEARLDAVNTAVTLRNGFTETAVRRLPPAVREAVLNGIAHRDWLQREAVAITYVQADSALVVVSPSGFVGGVSADNVLTQRYARYPALADLFRALGMVEKQGLGVDRMYREMVALGHRPPINREEPGPRVRALLAGGEPVVPVMNLLGRIEPAGTGATSASRSSCTRCSTNPTSCPSRSPAPSSAASRGGGSARGRGRMPRRDQPLLDRYKDVWVLSRAALAGGVPGCACGAQQPRHPPLPSDRQRGGCRPTVAGGPRPIQLRRPRSADPADRGRRAATARTTRTGRNVDSRSADGEERALRRGTRLVGPSSFPATG